MPSAVASATLQLRISALRLWYDFLIYQDICSLNPLPRSGLPGAIYTGRGLIPRITRLPVIPDDGQWLRFLKHVSAASLRDRLMLALAYYGALQRTEVTALRLEDIDLAHRLIRIRAETTKNRRERMVCYSADVARVLANHFQQLRLAGWSGGALFRSASDRNYGAPLSFWSWSKTVRKWATEADQPDITTHTFRHLRLTHLARAGWKLYELATYAVLRQNELMRLTAGCIIPQSEDINRDDGSTIPAGTLCYLNVLAGKTSKAFVKPVSAAVKKYVDIWLAE